MKSDKLENYIKNQLENREITPSRDLWSEIKMDTGESPQKSTKNNRLILLLAACFILIFGLAGLLFMKEQKQVDHISVAKLDQPVEIQQQKETVQPETPVKADTVTPVIRKESPKNTIAQQHPANTVQKQTSVQEIHSKPENVISVEEPKTAPALPNQEKIASSTTTKEQTDKKRKYVDPKILLFSVENREAIEKTKDGSNVASVQIHK
ncbi:hypothetical protein KRE40_11540 [Elizabethkingia meningoseptica]|uniref:hypothetical protein n=1 Tax=Elizabethkingia meningoseptica TaxID=238 RepID=UPI0023AF0F4D|nr:hypothetical protein [Elizabethkingia meningoseptica]MDE5439162.1 hypothetical protein [Elizabethkingia meningoseptica]MDE5509279.1 hypothetical protein [Elizabethkingia meningoseptica]MDE5516710.1 hypothetical protein [Elizabethkingia meningoseptica]MDE5527503.1 hypothetical protein [Elizabethkingia meningoseptica]MDE5530949.1 hypothetical protein [Elizabethkingia meningoseptica]